MYSLLVLLAFGLSAPPAPIRNLPVTMQEMWALNKTFEDRPHGVTFRYPACWIKTKESASYHGPALLSDAKIPAPVAFAFSEGGFPRTGAPHGPYTRTTLEAVDIVYAAQPVTDASACEALAVGVVSGNNPSNTFRVLNGIRYSVYSTGDAGMMQFINGLLYSTFFRGTCYLFETDLAGLEGGVDAGVPTLNKRDYGTIDAHLLTIMQTVHIAPAR